MRIYAICDYYIYKTDLSSFKKKRFSRQILRYLLPLESGNLQLEQTKFPVLSLCFGKISKFSVFSDRQFIFGYFPFSLCSAYPAESRSVIRAQYNLSYWGGKHSLTSAHFPQLLVLQIEGWRRLPLMTPGYVL